MEESELWHCIDIEETEEERLVRILMEGDFPEEEREHYEKKLEAAIDERESFFRNLNELDDFYMVEPRTSYITK